jgi:hypothetical protein
MFGMVTALVVQEPATASTGLAAPARVAAGPSTDPIRTAAVAAGSTSFICRVPGSIG